ncbi:tRNA (adenosine(37)-N6)-threonylcarbamoyltransferase complex dimerization subunit type 1 TsaB [Flavobacterium agricola]|uniref:tRNA (Adenosine(37)-N6)-threonylcarbamoyltransferase complex dimerization subunit type 1 TsaB n=1 Tax=Flavobacterium agricola TaxID=2870839 RepID=A0ABY6LX59_9FLAO|nr:tRNA (adenosine(37)-N6)-threonylcarbamoyltransferase complex dimerization subunit type 1 TsaB [Flavobacterium agricola]UYW00751.1 tRNA (adenosine(37)-N6)-threonylcarbamoyltransferase complex dimerization subunit type 1 TsaB [Flavobacterium agricola]
MALILNIETATKNCSVSLSNKNEIVALKEIATQGFAHAENLHVFIADVLEQANLSLADLDAVAVSQGPGSYTGLRIGVSAAKGLCYALGIPLLALDTLEILAQQVQIESGYIVSMLDARRMEVFMGVYSSNYDAVESVKAEIIDENTLASYSEPLHIIGDGALKCQEILKGSNFIYHPEILYPSAQQMGVLAYKKFETNQFEDVAYFEPYYLKDFVLTTSPKK